jgi:toxin-antitoxin system PIN domain toxin
LRSIADVNVFLPLLIGPHPAHGTASRWFNAQSDGAVGWCLPVKLGVLRLLCNPRVMGADTLAPVSALDVWNALAGDPRLTEFSRVPPGHDAALRRLIANRSPSPNLWTDAWLAALAGCLSCELVTFDRGFRAFEGLDLGLLEF